VGAEKKAPRASRLRLVFVRCIALKNSQALQADVRPRLSYITVVEGLVAFDDDDGFVVDAVLLAGLAQLVVLL